MLQKYSYITECYCNVTEKDVHRFIETIEYDRREALP
jgi:tagatose-1,6-bisphosphate aldolase